VVFGWPPKGLFLLAKWFSWAPWALRWWMFFSPAVLSMWLCKNFFSHQVQLFIFSRPARKTETGIANRWDTTNSKARERIIIINQSEIGSTSYIRSNLLQHLQARAHCIALLHFLPVWENCENCSHATIDPQLCSASCHRLSTAGACPILACWHEGNIKKTSADLTTK
jgi:hypothetical protein